MASQFAVTKAKDSNSIALSLWRGKRFQSKMFWSPKRKRY